MLKIQKLKRNILMVYILTSMAFVITYFIFITRAMVQGDGYIAIDYNSVNEGWVEWWLHLAVIAAGVWIFKNRKELIYHGECSDGIIKKIKIRFPSTVYFLIMLLIILLLGAYKIITNTLTPSDVVLLVVVMGIGWGYFIWASVPWRP